MIDVYESLNVCSYLPTFVCESLRAATTFTSTYSDTASKVNYRRRPRPVPSPIKACQRPNQQLPSTSNPAPTARHRSRRSKRRQELTKAPLTSAQFDTSRRTTSVVFDDENNSRRATPEDSDDSPKRRNTAVSSSRRSSSPKRRETEVSSSRRDSPPKRRDTGATQASSSRRDSSPERRETEVSSSRRDSPPKRRDTGAAAKAAPVAKVILLLNGPLVAWCQPVNVPSVRVDTNIERSLLNDQAQSAHAPEVCDPLQGDLDHLLLVEFDKDIRGACPVRILLPTDFNDVLQGLSHLVVQNPEGTSTGGSIVRR